MNSTIRLHIEYHLLVFDRLDDEGGGSILEGVYAGIESGWFMGEIAESAYRFEREVNAGDRVVVGVNAFTEGDEGGSSRLMRIGQDTEDLQRKRLAEVRLARDGFAVRTALARVADEAGRPEANLMPALLDAVRTRATVGEVVEVLEDVFGTYVETTVV